MLFAAGLLKFQVTSLTSRAIFDARENNNPTLPHLDSLSLSSAKKDAFPIRLGLPDVAVRLSNNGRTTSQSLGTTCLAKVNTKILRPHEPGSKLVVLGMGDLPPFIGNPYNGYINPYYWVDDHPLLYGNNGSLDPSTH